MSSNKDKGKWRKKIVKKGSHRHRSSGRSNIDLSFYRTPLLIILFVIIGFVGFNFILYLKDVIF